MLISVHQWRIHRLPLKPHIFKSLTSLIFTKPTSSAAVAKPLQDDDDAVSEILIGLKTFGFREFLREEKVKSLVSSLSSFHIDRILDHLRFEDANYAIELFNLLRDDYGFRHSRACVLKIAHLLAWRGERRALCSIIQQMLKQEGN